MSIARRRRTPEDARENILAAAESLLTETGPQSLKLAEVARVAGVAHPTVLHHFGSITGVQAALMTRMIERLAADILAISARVVDAEQMATESTRILVDTFGQRGVARLAAWLEMTGEAPRLVQVKEAVRAVITVPQAETRAVPPEVLEDFILVCINLALGVGLFGGTLDGLLGKPEGRSRTLAIGVLADRVRLALAEGDARANQ